MYYYAFTIRKTVPISTKLQSIKLMDRYLDILNYIFSPHNPKISHTFEIVQKLNGKQNLHLHAMIESSSALVMINIPRIKGMSIKFEECNSRLAWEIYISMEPYTYDDVIRYMDLQEHGNTQIEIEVSPMEIYKKLGRIV